MRDDRVVLTTHDRRAGGGRAGPAVPRRRGRDPADLRPVPRAHIAVGGRAASVGRGRGRHRDHHVAREHRGLRGVAGHRLAAGDRGAPQQCVPRAHARAHGQHRRGSDGDRGDRIRPAIRRRPQRPHHPRADRVARGFYRRVRAGHRSRTGRVSRHRLHDLHVGHDRAVEGRADAVGRACTSSWPRSRRTSSEPRTCLYLCLPVFHVSGKSGIYITATFGARSSSAARSASPSSGPTCAATGSRGPACSA